jgi:hypothetical protein
VARLVLSYDDGLLASAGADGAVTVLDVRDKELAKSPARRGQASDCGSKSEAPRPLPA